jgi:hypothetical protein
LKLNGYNDGVRYLEKQSFLKLSFPSVDIEALDSYVIALFTWSEHVMKSEQLGLSVRMASIEDGKRNYVSRCTFTSWYGALTQANLMRKLQGELLESDFDVIEAKVGTRKIALGPATTYSSYSDTRNFRLVYFM